MLLCDESRVYMCTIICTVPVSRTRVKPQKIILWIYKEYIYIYTQRLNILDCYSCSVYIVLYCKLIQPVSIGAHNYDLPIFIFFFCKLTVSVLDEKKRQTSGNRAKKKAYNGSITISYFKTGLYEGVTGYGRRAEGFHAVVMTDKTFYYTYNSCKLINFKCVT